MGKGKILKGTKTEREGRENGTEKARGLWKAALPPLLADWQTGLQRPHHTEPTCRTHLALPTPLDEVTAGPQPYLHSGHIPAQGAGSAPS